MLNRVLNVYSEAVAYLLSSQFSVILTYTCLANDALNLFLIFISSNEHGKKRNFIISHCHYSC